MWEVVSALVGAALGSLMTFYLGHIAGARNEKRQSKLRLFTVLMGGRGAIHSDKIRLHVNLIPVVFHDDEKVRAAYLHFCASVTSPGTEYVKRLVELLIQISRSLGFSTKVSEADIYTGFFVTEARPSES